MRRLSFVCVALLTLGAGCGASHDADGLDAGLVDDAASLRDSARDALVADDTLGPMDTGQDGGPPEYDPSRLSLCARLESRSVSAVSPDGQLVALVGSGSIEIVGASDGHTRATLVLPVGSSATVLGFTAASDALVLAEGTDLVVHTFATGARATTALHSHSGVGAGVVTTDAAILVVDGVVEEVAFGGSPRVITATLGPTPQQVAILPTGDLLLVTTDALTVVARTDGARIARTLSPTGDSFAQAALLADGTIVAARQTGLSLYDAGLALLAALPMAAPALGASGTHVLVGASGGISVLDLVRVGSAARLDPLATLPVDAWGEAAQFIATGGNAIAASTAGGALVVAHDPDLVVQLRRDALAMDASAGAALLSGHRVVLATGVVSLDTASLVQSFAAPARLVLGAEDARRALLAHDATIEVLDDALASTSLPLPDSAAILAIAPDSSTIGSARGTSIQTFALESGRLDTTTSPTDVRALALGPNGSPVYVATIDQRIYALDASGPIRIGSDATLATPVASIDGATLAVEALSGSSFLFATATGAITPLPGALGPMAFTDAGRWLFYDDGSSLWAQPVDGHRARIRIASGLSPAVLLLAPDGELAVSATRDGLTVYCLPESSLHP